MKYFLIFLFISPSVCFAHTQLTHEHKSSIVGHNPHRDGINYDYTHDGTGNNPSPATYTKNGVSYYRTHTHPLSAHHINGWKHPGYGDPQYYENPEKKDDPEEPTNPPIKHRHCYGDGTDHFHKVDERGYWHGIDHSDLSLVGGIFTEIHIHPVCEDEKPVEPCVDCKKPAPIHPSGVIPSGLTGASLPTLKFTPADRQATRCMVGWRKGSSKVVIHTIDIAADISDPYPFKVKAIEIRADESVETLNGYFIQLNTPGNTMGRPKPLRDGLTFQDGSLWIDDLDFPTQTGFISSRRVPLFLYKILSPQQKTIDIATSCYVDVQGLLNAFKETRIVRLQRNIETLDWTANFYRSQWRAVETSVKSAPSAPSLRKPKLTTLWATLKH